MLTRLIEKAGVGVARLARGAERVFREFALLFQSGPKAYAGFARTHRVPGSRRGVTFANGVTTVLSPQRAQGWHMVRGRPLVIALRGQSTEDVASWMGACHALIRCHFVADYATVATVGNVPERALSAYGHEAAPASDDLFLIWDWMHRSWRRWDLVLLDAGEPLPDPALLVQLQHAAYQYHHDEEIGFVTPAYRAGSTIAPGYGFDRGRHTLSPFSASEKDYGQSAVPRYVLTAPWHGFYATSTAIDRVDVAERHFLGLSSDQQVAALVRRGWAGNYRTLCLSSTVFEVSAFPHLTLQGENARWQTERATVGPDGRTRLIFVLNATSVSGGIRAVFELANGLEARGFNVEIWSLEPHPTWFDLHVPVRQFRNYEDLLLSLRTVDSIKVATWWETAEIVWLASVNHGVPVYLIQEFETWFYPDDPLAQAAVVASYRAEFLSLTEASYQRGELAEVGIDATLIPHGYDDNVFRVLPAVERDSRSVLALGRSFFQKNFDMTLRAWRSLGESRPLFLLFGGEPDIVSDSLVEYHERPRDAQVNELYNRATVFVQTSRHEGFCLPILEAMAAGCPVITTDSHGNRDFCHDGENCVIVPQDDDAALADALRLLLDSPHERERLSIAGLETARRLRWPVVLDQVAAFYAAVSAGAATPRLPIESTES